MVTDKPELYNDADVDASDTGEPFRYPVIEVPDLPIMMWAHSLRDPDDVITVPKQISNEDPLDDIYTRYPVLYVQTIKLPKELIFCPTPIQTPLLPFGFHAVGHTNKDTKKLLAPRTLFELPVDEYGTVKFAPPANFKYVGGNFGVTSFELTTDVLVIDT
jgi:hypothetical protein